MFDRSSIEFDRLTIDVRSVSIDSRCMFDGCSKDVRYVSNSSLTPSESRIPDTIPLVVSQSLVVTPTISGSSLQSTIVIHCRQPVYTDVVTHTHTTVTAILKLSAPGTIGSVLSSQWFPSEPCCSAITTMAARSSASASVRTRRPFVSH